MNPRLIKTKNHNTVSLSSTSISSRFSRSRGLELSEGRVYFLVWKGHCIDCVYSQGWVNDSCLEGAFTWLLHDDERLLLPLKSFAFSAATSSSDDDDRRLFSSRPPVFWSKRLAFASVVFHSSFESRGLEGGKPNARVNLVFVAQMRCCSISLP